MTRAVTGSAERPRTVGAAAYYRRAAVPRGAVSQKSQARPGIGPAPQEGRRDAHGRGSAAAARRPADARRRARDRAATRARAARPACAPRPAAARGDAAGLGRFRRAGSARSVVAAVRRHVRAVDGRDAARRRRGPERRSAAGGEATRSGATTCATWPRLRRRVRVVVAEQRAALEHVHPDPAAWPAVLAAGRMWERRQRRRRLRPAPRWDRRAAAGHRTGRAADRSGGRARAGDGARPAPVPAGARGRHRPARSRCRCTGPRRSGSQAAPGAGPWHARALARASGRAVRAVARPDGRAARGGRPRVPGAGVGVGQVAAARRSIRGSATPSGRCG